MESVSFLFFSSYFLFGHLCSSLASPCVSLRPLASPCVPCFISFFLSFVTSYFVSPQLDDSFFPSLFLSFSLSLFLSFSLSLFLSFSLSLFLSLTLPQAFRVGEHYNLVKAYKNGEIAIFMAANAVLMYLYHHETDTLRGSARGIVKMVLG